MITLGAKCSDQSLHGEQRHLVEPPPRRWPLSCNGERVLVSASEDEASKYARELQGLPTDTFGLTVWPEKARGELATCARGGAVVHGGGTAAPGTATRR